MKIIKVKDYEEMSYEAAKMIINQLGQSPSSVLGLATGGTPIGTYKYLIEDYKKNKTSYKQVYTVNLDEYMGIGPNDVNSYAFYMRENLFNHIDIPIEQTNIPNGMATNFKKECERYEQLIHSLGGVDLQLVGIGLNGHIGFNEPGTSFQSKTKVVDLAPSTREANSRYFPNEEKVPTQAITMGIATIMQSKQILFLVSGKEKAEILTKVLFEEITEQVPASVLKNHPNVTIIADRDALSLVKERKEMMSYD